MSATLLAATAALAAGCSSAVERGGPSTTERLTATSVPSVSAPVTMATSTAVPSTSIAPAAGSPASAWIASMNAFYRAALADQPDAPTFVATLVPGSPVFTHTVGYLTALATEGVEGASSWRVGNASVVRSSGTAATVTGCAFDSGSRWHSSGQAAPAAYGGGAGYTAATALLVRRGGTWLVDEASSSPAQPSEDGPCHGF